MFTSRETIFLSHSPNDFWRNLSSNKAQTDQIVNQKHLSMLYAIKIKCININEQVVSIFSRNLRSDPERERRHDTPFFPVGTP